MMDLLRLKNKSSSGETKVQLTTTRKGRKINSACGQPPLKSDCGIRRLTGRADVEYKYTQDRATGLGRRFRSKGSKRQSMSGRERNALKTPLISERSCQQNLCKVRENITFMGNSEQASEDS